MSQTLSFLIGESNAWFDRNRLKIGTPESIKADMPLKLLSETGIKPKSILEIGCANGWRLNECYKRYQCGCTGIEPSVKAVHDAAEQFRDVQVQRGMAHWLPFPDDSFDLVIYGFCLYLVEPLKLFAVMQEGDRVLKDKGFMLIYDFFAEEPHSVNYHHVPGLRSHKMDFYTLWTAHPAYKRIKVMGDSETEVSLLYKDLSNSFPLKVIT